MKRMLSAFSLLTLITLAHAIEYKKIMPDLGPEAKCLDGSSPALYIYQGSEPENILIWLVGNGTCFQAGKNT